MSQQNDMRLDVFHRYLQERLERLMRPQDRDDPVDANELSIIARIKAGEQGWPSFQSLRDTAYYQVRLEIVRPLGGRPLPSGGEQELRRFADELIAQRFGNPPDRQKIYDTVVTHIQQMPALKDWRDPSSSEPTLKATEQQKAALKQWGAAFNNRFANVGDKKQAAASFAAVVNDKLKGTGLSVTAGQVQAWREGKDLPRNPDSPEDMRVHDAVMAALRLNVTRAHMRDLEKPLSSIQRNEGVLRGDMEDWRKDAVGMFAGRAVGESAVASSAPRNNGVKTRRITVSGVGEGRHLDLVTYDDPNIAGLRENRAGRADGKYGGVRYEFLSIPEREDILEDSQNFHERLIVARLLKEAKVGKRWSQEAVGKAIGAHDTLVGDWEKGQGLPTPDKLKALKAIGLVDQKSEDLLIKEHLNAVRQDKSLTRTALGAKYSKVNHLRGMPPSYWQEVLAQTYDPHGWEKREARLIADIARDEHLERSWKLEVFLPQSQWQLLAIIRHGHDLIQPQLAKLVAPEIRMTANTIHAFVAYMEAGDAELLQHQGSTASAVAVQLATMRYFARAQEEAWNENPNAPKIFDLSFFDRNIPRAKDAPAVLPIHPADQVFSERWQTMLEAGIAADPYLSAYRAKYHGVARGASVVSEKSAPGARKTILPAEETVGADEESNAHEDHPVAKIEGGGKPHSGPPSSGLPDRIRQRRKAPARRRGH